VIPTAISIAAASALRSSCPIIACYQAAGVPSGRSPLPALLLQRDSSPCSSVPEWLQPPCLLFQSIRNAGFFTGPAHHAIVNSSLSSSSHDRRKHFAEILGLQSVLYIALHRNILRIDPPPLNHLPPPHPVVGPDGRAIGAGNMHTDRRQRRCRASGKHERENGCGQ
jgi:hypothetical protein